VEARQGGAVMALVLFKLMIGHALCDFSLQTDSMAKGKNRHRKTEPPPGAKYAPSWFFWLPAHALIHAGAVWLITGSPALSSAEFVLHATIDFGKCENWYGMNTDQAAHVLCKLAWAVASV
jgi:hypothetical protein